jgi:hypothetical protein
MSLEELLVENDDVIRIRAKYTKCCYDKYTKSLEKYIPWIKEQISKSKEDFIKIKREDLARTMRGELKIIMGDTYRDIKFKSLYDMIRVILFNEGIFTELDYYNKKKIFIMRNRKPEDSLILKLAKLEKNMKK